jgi:hypothetical protein
MVNDIKSDWVFGLCPSSVILDTREQRLTPDRAKAFCLAHCVQTDSGSHPASYAVGTEAFSLGS